MKYYHNLKENKPIVSEEEIADENFFEITQEELLTILSVVATGAKYIVVDGKLVIDEEEAKRKRTSSIRLRRDAMLKACDWTILPDSPFSPEQREKWVTYRQALRDITLQKGFPDKVIFPDKPQ